MMSHNDDIFDELEESSILRSLKGKEPFDAPEGYFDQLSSVFQNKLDDEEVLEAAPSLTSIGKENIWMVPKGYFEKLPERVFGRLKEDEEATVRPFWGRMNPSLIWVAAAAVLLLLVIWMGVSNQTQPNKEGNEFAKLNELPQEELYEVLDEAGVDGYDLMAAISGDEDLIKQFAGETEEELFEKLYDDEMLEELELGDLEDLIMDL